MRDYDDAEVWEIQGVHGQVSFLVNDEVVLLHTGDEKNVPVDMFMAMVEPGCPIEMTREQAIGLAELMLRVLKPDSPAEGD